MYEITDNFLKIIKYNDYLRNLVIFAPYIILFVLWLIKIDEILFLKIKRTINGLLLAVSLFFAILGFTYQPNLDGIFGKLDALRNVLYFLLSIGTLVNLFFISIFYIFLSSFANYKRRNILATIIISIFASILIKPFFIEYKVKNSLSYILTGGYHVIDAKVNDEHIYFIDYEDENGYLSKVDFEGKNKEILVKTEVSSIDGIIDNSIYYTSYDKKFKYDIETKKVTQINQEKLIFDSKIHKYGFYTKTANLNKNIYYECVKGQICKNENIIIKNNNYERSIVLGTKNNYLYLAVGNENKQGGIFISKIIKYNLKTNKIVNEIKLNNELYFAYSDYNDDCIIIGLDYDIYIIDFNNFKLEKFFYYNEEVINIYLYDNILALVQSRNFDPEIVTFVDLENSRVKIIDLPNDTQYSLVDFYDANFYYLDGNLKTIKLDDIFETEFTS